jgi:UDP-N-acetylglucosamine:LPS N-acetylglucosamine transferase
MKSNFLFIIPSLGAGGAERQMIQLIQLLNDEYKIVPTVVTYSSKNKDYENLIKMKILNLKKSNKIGLLKQFLKVIKEIKPDSILAYGTSASMIAVLTTLFNKNVNVVVSERNMSLNYDVKTKLRFNLFRMSNSIVVNSVSQTKFITKHAPFLNSKVKLIRNYTDIEQFEFVVKNKPSILKIGVFARYNKQKNTLNFLKAVEKFNASN